MQSKAKTVSEYLSSLPDDRRTAIEAVRKVILKNLDRDYEEGMQYGMIGYYVPHSVYPPGYHCDPKQPLPFLCLASQKNYMSLYMMAIYEEGENLDKFQQSWAKTGKKLDMGKSCIRFRKVDDLALDVIADVIRRMPAKKFVTYYESAMQQNAERKATRSVAKKPAKGKMAARRVRKKVGP